MKRIYSYSGYWVRILIVLSSLLAMTAFATVNQSGVSVKWGYKGNIGPERWGQLNPAFTLCASGKSQSPINIIKKVINTPNTLTIQYESAPMAIVEDGATSLMIGNAQTIINDGHGVQLNFTNEKWKETIIFQGKEYHLIQFHMHSPSENEWHGQAFPMEIHFVHQSDDGHVAVIGVFVKGGAANKALQKIIDNFPKNKGVVHVIQNERINPVDLIPAKHDYFNFLGSLTTPPCTEGLQWIVMPGTITASPAQIVLFRKEAGGANARPVQPLHKRVVYFSGS